MFRRISYAVFYFGLKISGGQQKSKPRLDD